MKTFWDGQLMRMAGVVLIGVVLMVLCSQVVWAQAPSVRWAQQGISSNNLSGAGIALDDTGNIFAIGEFHESVRIGLVTLDSGQGTNLFLAKYAPSGKPLWAIKAGGTNSHSGVSPKKSVATDPLGNAYIAGSFQFVATLGDFTTTNDAGNTYGVIAKVDSLGNYLWAKTLESTEDTFIYGLAVASNGNIYVAGFYTGKPNFGGTNLGSANGGFIAKLDNNGSILWAVQNDTGPIGIALDSDGNVFATGSIYSMAYVWSDLKTNLSNRASFDAYVAKYDNDGKFIWVSSFGNPSLYPHGGYYGAAIATGGDGSIYMTGYELSSTYKGITCKFTSTGSLAWTRYGTGGSKSGPLLYAVSVDASNSVYVTGFYVGNTVFEGITLPGTLGLCIGKYDSLGSLQWISGFPGTSGVIGMGVATSSEGDNIYLTGYYASALSFGGQNLSTPNNKKGNFLVKLGTGANSTSDWIAVGLDGKPALGTNYIKRRPTTISLLSSFGDGGIVAFNLDGADPRSSNNYYTSPFTVGKNSKLRAIAYNADMTQSVESDPISISILPTIDTLTAGGGVVAVDPPEGAYYSNSVVWAHAMAAPGWRFLKWLGDVSSTNNPVSLTMNRNKTVQAVFGAALQYNVSGGGTVVANPTFEYYPFGTRVGLSAKPLAGNYFLQWGNSVAGTNNPIDFVVTNSHPTIGAAFGALDGSQYALSVITDGSGHVETSPFANRYNNGQIVTLTALPDAFQDFTGWSGDAIGVQISMVVTMNQNRTVTANFTKRPALHVDSPLEGPTEEGFRLKLTGEFEEHYAIYSSTNLTDWVQLGTTTNTFGSSEFTDSAGTNLPYRFYRAERQ